MIHINGSTGEGGGQILRSALTLSVLSGKPFEIERIRANRSKPGLMRQHLAAVKAAQAICEAKVAGDDVGSSELRFEPRKVRPGDYEFAIGTAGSAMLVFQTVLLPLLCAESASKVRIQGGTHNPFAPPFDYVEQCFVPLLRKMGASLSLELVRPGFYPAGGGDFIATIQPSVLRPIEICGPQTITRRVARAVVAGLPWHIAQRELTCIQDSLKFHEDEIHGVELDARFGPGNVLTVALHGDEVTEVFSNFGEKSKTAEDVADELCREVEEYLGSGCPVGSHTADQLLLPLAVAGGGRFRTMKPSRHTVTNMQVIELFLDVEASWAELSPDVCEITLERKV
ncbi:MAG: RNA 3'-terminal phosphate cyclase [Bdellovibrionota bacterium]